MKRFLWSRLAILALFGACLGCGEKAVVPTGPIESPKQPPKTMPMIGPKLSSRINAMR